jgi:hypothetical protein
MRNTSSNLLHKSSKRTLEYTSNNMKVRNWPETLGPYIFVDGFIIDPAFLFRSNSNLSEL